MEELLRWPALRFEKFYEAFQRRKVIEELTLRKITVAAALYANANFDSEENQGKRDQFIENLEEQFSEQVASLYRPLQRKKAEDEMKQDPFFQAMERGLVKQGVPTLKELM